MAPSVKAMASRIPKLKIIVIPDADHFTIVGDGFVEGTANFLREHRDAR